MLSECYFKDVVLRKMRWLLIDTIFKIVLGSLKYRFRKNLYFFKPHSGKSGGHLIELKDT